MEYVIKNDKISFAASSRGAEPLYLRSADQTEYLWRGSKEYWPGRAPHLFPLIGRLFETRYTVGGKSYPLSIHGFLKDRELALESQTDCAMSFRLDSDEETRERYPFDFSLYVRYAVEGYALKITFEVKNLGSGVMPFAFGGHPGFNVPLDKELGFADYRLEFSESSSPKRVEPMKSNLFSGRFLDYPLKDGKVIELEHGLFDDDAIILKDTAKSVTLKSGKGSRAVKVDFPDFKYIGFWHTVGSDAPFVCIEPWTAVMGCDGAVQALEDNEDLIRLNAEEVYKNEWSVTVIE